MAPSDFAFDALAAEYDRQFTNSRIGTLMRQAIWRRLAVHFHPGQRILELNCGTGADAVHLARHGVRVLATDLSGEMVAIARHKVATANLGDLIEVQQLAIEQLDTLDLPLMDGALSNFGGLNCVADLSAVARALARQLRPGAYVFLCVMGPLVPWEWGWFLWHRQPGKAWRRLRPGGVAWRGLTLHYPCIRTVQQAFASDFRRQRASAIGALLPPPYMEHWMSQHPRLLESLDRWERRLEAIPPLPWLADHYLLELERV